jgi:hypothetical protein
MLDLTAIKMRLINDATGPDDVAALIGEVEGLRRTLELSQGICRIVGIEVERLHKELHGKNTVHRHPCGE